MAGPRNAGFSELHAPDFFHGRIFRIGNAAAFLEPLEATAIGTAIVEVRAATEWMATHGPQSSADPGEIEEHNASLRTYIRRDSWSSDGTTPMAHAGTRRLW